MRTSPLSILTVLAGFCSASLAAVEPLHPTYFNLRVSSQSIALNEPVRVEFTTMPREVDGVDIATSVANSLRLGDGQQWRLVGTPTVTELVVSHGHPSDPNKPGTPYIPPKAPLTISFRLLPRISGDVKMPQIPITWLDGNQVLDLPQINVNEKIRIGTDTADPPKEVKGVDGYPWNVKLTDVTPHIPANHVETLKDRTLIHPQKNLTLDFVGGFFTQAELVAPGLSMDQARVEFLQHWGLPQIDDKTGLTWILGWTRITVTPDAAASGIDIELVREDLTGNLTRAQVTSEVFNVLGGGGAIESTPSGDPAEKGTPVAPTAPAPAPAPADNTPAAPTH